MARSGYETNLASEFYVLSVLYRRGFDATLTLGNKKAVDIVVILDEGRTATIDVKANTQKLDWLIGSNKPAPDPRHYLVLVGYENSFSDPTILPRCWVIPAEEANGIMKTSAKGNLHYLPRKAVLDLSETYEDAWHLIR